MSRNFKTPPSLTKPSPANPRIKNVTNQILDTHKIYGSSDSTNQNSTSLGKLNYANGASFDSAWEFVIRDLEITMHWEGTVGLPGAENEFTWVAFDLDPNLPKWKVWIFESGIEVLDDR